MALNETLRAKITFWCLDKQRDSFILPSIQHVATQSFYKSAVDRAIDTELFSITNLDTAAFYYMKIMLLIYWQSIQEPISIANNFTHTSKVPKSAPLLLPTTGTLKLRCWGSLRLRKKFRESMSNGSTTRNEDIQDAHTDSTALSLLPPLL